jgi:hypothetical protein
MSITLKTNTAIRIVVGPFIDKADGFTLKTGMTVTNLAMNLWQEHDDGSAPTKIIDGVHFTAAGGSNDMIELSDGFYEIELTAAQLNFIGRAKFQIFDIDVILPYFESWQIVSTIDYESIVIEEETHILTAAEASIVLRCTVTDSAMLAILPGIDAFIQRATGRNWALEDPIPEEAKNAARMLLVMWHENPGMMGGESQPLGFGLAACFFQLTTLGMNIREFHGHHSAGFCHLSTALEGDQVTSLVGLVGASGDQSAAFETVISRDGHIQQISSSDLSEMIFRVRLTSTNDLSEVGE